MIIKEKSLDEFETSHELMDSQVSWNRIELQYSNLSLKFKNSNKDFSKQFAHIYSRRLKQMNEVLLKKVVTKWGDKVSVRILSDLADANLQRCIIIGTLFKHQELKPSLLKEISEEHQLIPQPPRSHYTSTNDIIVLEDETQRVRLVGNLRLEDLATGVVIAVLGHENDQGRFEVEEHCFPGVEPLHKAPTTLPSDCYVAIVSGLHLNKSGNLFTLQLFLDWITAVSGSTTDQSTAASICRLILAGNSIGAAPPSETTGVGNIAATSVLEATKLLDEVCLELAKTIPVDVMPGEFDSTNHMLPQQPLLSCILPKATRLQSCRPVSNPYQFEVGGRRVLGTTGQPIDNLARVTDGVNPIDLLECTLRWGHMAPTAPDTLACYPYYETDPFIIGQQPEVYFAGNQPHFQTKLVTPAEGRPVRLICIPSFAESPTCVMVNLRTLDCYPVTFLPFKSS